MNKVLSQVRQLSPEPATTPRQASTRGSWAAAMLAGGLAYMIGSFPTADLVSAIARRRQSDTVDLRETGTGNPGALNAAKVLGPAWGISVLIGDIFKGASASLLGRRIADANGAYFAGAMSVVGHCFPVWRGFRGGKGVATSAGTCLACFPAYFPIDVAVAGGTIAFSRGRAELATGIASAVFIGAAVYWWRKGKRNFWGPPPTAGLPLYAVLSSAVIVHRFLTAPRPPRASARETAK